MRTAVRPPVRRVARLTGALVAAGLALAAAPAAASAAPEENGSAAVNTPPVAVDDVFTTPFETAIDLTLCGNDLDAEQNPIGAGDIQNISGGFFTNTNGQLCTFTFVPEPGFSGAASFTYYAFDRADATIRSAAPATVLISVGPPPAEPTNTLPVAGDDTATTARNTLLVLPAAAVLVNDVDVDGDVLTVQGATPLGGAIPGEDWAVDVAQLRYWPAPDFVGTRQFLLHIADGTGAVTSVLTIIVTADEPEPGQTPEPVPTPEPAPAPTTPAEGGATPANEGGFTPTGSPEESAGRTPPAVAPVAVTASAGRPETSTPVLAATGERAIDALPALAAVVVGTTLLWFARARARGARR